MYLPRVSIWRWSLEKRGKSFRIALAPAQTFRKTNQGKREKLYSVDSLVNTRAGTRLFKNRRLIEYLKEATRSARLGTRSVLGAAGKFEI